jgi:hypothetical protein
MRKLKHDARESLTDFSKRFLDQQEVNEVAWGVMTPQLMKDKFTDEQNEGRDWF